MNADYVNDCLNRLQSTIDQALTELMEVKMIRENDPTEFPYLQNELNELDIEITLLLEKNQEGSHHTRLQEAQKKLHEVQDIMIRGV
ncbi:hypothetical protein [Halalkalibacter alkalisediminis]|uniref:DUF2524 domain-containing protein n=1 Tax=Halalkalibacter alkalisediminis TaxID=935616 RepID=A0ABV6NGG7_9BACI|nr:hypothetical protein [Halalkalibacter alkalisediminis]